MKKYITLIMIVAMTFLFVGQSDSFAKTAQAASEELSKATDGEIYYQVRAPRTFEVEAEMDEQKDEYRLGRWFVTEVEALQNKVSRFWHQMLPKFERIYHKYIAVVD